jgi:carbamoyl-phosphate synthase small subunit
VTKPKPALLALEDGSVFRGHAFGAEATITGEVCFNTSMTGYQEVLTDPSYRGEIVTMTAPHIGNTGVNAHDTQSRRPWLAGFVVRELSTHPSSWRSEQTLDAFLADHGVPGITGVDTRRLTRHLRSNGALLGAISSAVTDRDELVDIARAAPGLVGRDIVTEVTTPEPYTWGPHDLMERATSGYAAGAEPGRAPGGNGRRFKVAALDFGLKQNILDLLVASGCDVTVLPAHTSADEILALGPDGVFLSNGPGDPEPVTYAIETIKNLLGRVPIFGICLGHQLLALAAGARTFKLSFGHRGGNHPVARVGRDSIEITCQNHGFAVEPASLEGTEAQLTHRNLNDGTMEGLSIPGLAFSVQYHPESGPGPHDSRYLFEDFRSLMGSFTQTVRSVSA